MNPFERIEENGLVVVVYKSGDFVQKDVKIVQSVTNLHIIVRGSGYFSRKTGRSCGPRAADMSECYLEEPATPAK